MACSLIIINGVIFFTVLSCEKNCTVCTVNRWNSILVGYVHTCVVEAETL